jgi:UDP:flavonoid glycosyltransferase YjiC (YdhE family)
MGGDLPPLIAVARELSERGHAVTLLGDADLAVTGGQIGLRVLPSDGRYDISTVYREARAAASGLSPSGQGERLADGLIQWSSSLTPALTEALEAEAFDSVVASTFFATAAAPACLRRGLPWAIVRSSFYQGPGSTRPLESDYSPVVVPVIRRVRLPVLERANLVLHPTVPEFEFPLTDVPAHHHFVGPLFWEPESSDASYLDEPGEPWVLVNVSTVAQADLPMVDAALAGLRSRPVRVLVTLGADRHPEDLAEIPPNVRVERYVSHTQVLRRASLVVSRAGFGIVMKALHNGVPMVLVPWGSDQQGVAARASRLGAAQTVDFEDVGRTSMTQAIETVLGSRSFATAAKRASAVLHAQGGPAAACSLLERLDPTRDGSRSG